MFFEKFQRQIIKGGSIGFFFPYPSIWRGAMAPCPPPLNAPLATAMHSRQNCLAHTGPQHGNHVREWHIWVTWPKFACRKNVTTSIKKKLSIAWVDYAQCFWCLAIISHTASDKILSHPCRHAQQRLTHFYTEWANGLNRFFLNCDVKSAVSLHGFIRINKKKKKQSWGRKESWGRKTNVKIFFNQ